MPFEIWSSNFPDGEILNNVAPARSVANREMRRLLPPLRQDTGGM
jgi:hypothetical protein